MTGIADTSINIAHTVIGVAQIVIHHIILDFCKAFNMVPYNSLSS